MLQLLGQVIYAASNGILEFWLNGVNVDTATAGYGLQTCSNACRHWIAKTHGYVTVSLTGIYGSILEFLILIRYTSQLLLHQQAHLHADSNTLLLIQSDWSVKVDSEQTILGTIIIGHRLIWVASDDDVD